MDKYTMVYTDNNNFMTDSMDHERDRILFKILLIGGYSVELKYIKVKTREVTDVLSRRHYNHVLVQLEFFINGHVLEDATNMTNMLPLLFYWKLLS